jgi:hypothetical protein
MSVNGSSQVNNSGTITVGGNYQNNGQTNSANGSITITGSLTNNGGAIFSVGVGNINGSVQNNGDINIHGALDVQGSVQMNGGSSISAGNNNQPNYLFVNGDLTGAGCLNGNNGILFTNQFQSSGGDCRNGEVFIGTASGCLEIVDLPIFQSGGEDFFERVYIFRCSTGWIIPGPNEEADVLDEAQILIVAGGGGGGRGSSAGGGGAGGLIYLPSELLPFGTVVPVIVGAGGAGAPPSPNAIIRGTNGTPSEFLGNIAIGGGGGGSVVNNENRNGNPGGSGGGGAMQGTNDGIGESGTSGQGNNGAQGNNTFPPSRLFGGGGGGAGSPGNQGPFGNPVNGGGGGNGVSFSVSGTSIFYSAGGGGTSSGPGTQNGPGGSNVGGNGNNSGAGGSGSTPGSAGGAGSTRGGNGANGIVIIRQTFRILPVEYLYFDAYFRREERAAEIKWATGKEWENSHFEIQRSMGNVNSWVTIGKVDGVGWSDSPVDYTFKDNSLPLVGGMAYYRLNQVDFDGKFHLSKVVSIRIPSQQVTDNVWRAFPNPYSGDRFNLDLLDAAQYGGEVLRIRLVSPTAGNNFIQGDDLREISELIRRQLENSPKGVYVLEISWGKKVEYLKVLRK